MSELDEILLVDKAALEAYYFSESNTTKGQEFIRQRTASTVRQETETSKENSSEKDEFEEDTDISEEARLLSVSNTRPFYLDHHLQTAIQKEALVANKFRRFRDESKQRYRQLFSSELPSLAATGFKWVIAAVWTGLIVAGVWLAVSELYPLFNITATEEEYDLA